MTRHRFPPPAEWQSFEDLCHDLFRELWDTPTVVKHGRGGKAQDGVDLYGLLQDGSWCGVQCKEKGDEKQLTRAEMRKELAKADGFNPRLTRYIFATTADRSPDVQSWARTLSEEGSFEVTVFAWDDFCEALTGRYQLIRRHFSSVLPSGGGDIATRDSARALDAFRQCHWSELLPLPSLAQARGQRHADLLLTDIYTALDVKATVHVSKTDKEPAKVPVAEGPPTSISLPGDRRYLDALIAHEQATFDADTSRHAPRESQRLCRALEAAAANRLLVLVGGAGSGKSTFGRFLVACLLGESLGESEANLAALGGVDSDFVTWPHGAPLSFFVSLAKFTASAAFPAAGEAGTAQHLLQYLEHLGPKLSLPAFARGFGDELKRPNGVLVILDGLDETQAAEASRIQLREIISGFVRAHKDCRMLVTSRPYAYEKKSRWRLDDAGFTSVALASFDHEQQRTFIEAWYRRLVARGLLSVPDERRQEMSSDLVRQVRRTDYLGPLARNPLMLTMMADLHASNGGRLPTGGRAALYAASLELLLDRWNESRDGRKPTEDLGMSLKQIEEALQKLAFEVHRSRGAGDKKTPEIARTELWDALVSVRSTTEDAGPTDDTRIMDYLHQRSGILIGESPKVYRFPHRSYQEYLAAAYLVNKEDFPTLLSEVSVENPVLWREVVQLTVGQTAEKKSMAWTIIDMLVPEDPQDETLTLEDPHFLRALLAGLSIRETQLWKSGSEANTPKLKRVRRWLRRTIELGALEVKDRAQAGQVLGLLGDKRPGVALGADGLPSFKWVEFPASSFIMGSELFDAEKPVHEEHVEAFKISRYPLTNVQYQAFIDDGGYQERLQHCWTVVGWEAKGDHQGPRSFGDPFDLPNHPRIGISWHEAVAFCQWLSERTGSPFRLPTEAEWERAARGEDGREYPWGQHFQADLGNFGAEAGIGIGSTTAVGLFPGGESPKGTDGLGLLDASGNVWEWCSSQWRDNYEKPASDNHEGDAARVLRGGSFVVNDFHARCAFRVRDLPVIIFRIVGFRLAAPI